MVEAFEPDLTSVLAFDEQLGTLPKPNFRRMEYRDVEEFINADTKRKLEHVQRKFGPIFSDDLDRKEKLEDIEAARFMLIKALDIKHALDSKPADSSLFDQLGIWFQPLKQEQMSLFLAMKERVEGMFSKYDPDALNTPTSRYLKRFLGLDATKGIAHCCWTFGFEKNQYARYLEKACNALEHWGCHTDDEGFFSFDFNPGFYQCDEAGMTECLRDVVDGFFSLHLTDIRTISTDGGNESRIAGTAISSIWWAALDKIRDGRLGKCKACERPFIASRERGSKRRFCSDACRQWAAAHPGETRRAKPAR